MQTEQQNKKILKELLAGERPTARMASHVWGIDRLSARIYDLNERGWDIDKVMKPNSHNGGMHAEYFLKDHDSVSREYATSLANYFHNKYVTHLLGGIYMVLGKPQVLISFEDEKPNLESV